MSLANQDTAEKPSSEMASDLATSTIPAPHLPANQWSETNTCEANTCTSNTTTVGASVFSPVVDLRRVAVVIPALNEVHSLPLVLDDLPDDINVIVVNNGSTDHTPYVAIQMGANLVDEPQRGYGKACLSGLAEIDRMVREDAAEIDVVAFVDGDYSDHVHLIEQVVAPIMLEEKDFVLGSRLTGKREKGAMPPQSIWGNRLACGLMRLFFGGPRYTDLGPMRAIRRSSLQEIGMVDENFGWTIEMQIKALKHKLRIEEIPVPYRCRVGVSKISGTISGSFKAGVKILYSIWLYGFRK